MWGNCCFFCLFWEKIYGSKVEINHISSSRVVGVWTPWKHTVIRGLSFRKCQCRTPIFAAAENWTFFFFTAEFTHFFYYNFMEKNFSCWQGWVIVSQSFFKCQLYIALLQFLLPKVRHKVAGGKLLDEVGSQHFSSIYVPMPRRIKISFYVAILPSHRQDLYFFFFWKVVQGSRTPGPSGVRGPWVRVPPDPRGVRGPEENFRHWNLPGYWKLHFL